MTVFLYAALCALFLIVLSAGTVRARRRERVALGMGTTHALQRWVRAQGNFTEYTPLFLIQLALLELAGLPALWLHLGGSLYLIGRLLHATSLLGHEQYRDGRLVSPPHLRVAGMAITLTLLGLCAACLLILWFLPLFLPG